MPRNYFEARVHAFFDYIIGRYGVALEWVLARQRLTMVVFLITLVLTGGRWLVSNMEPVEVPCQP